MAAGDFIVGGFPDKVPEVGRDFAENIPPDPHRMGGAVLGFDTVGGPEVVRRNYLALLEGFSLPEGEEGLGLPDTILVERAHSLMSGKSQGMVDLRYGITGPRYSREEIMRQLAITRKGLDKKLSDARRSFAEIAGVLDGDDAVDLIAWRREHPYAKSPLVLLAHLHVPIRPDARLAELRARSLTALGTRHSYDHVRVMDLLYGLTDGKPKTTTEVGTIYGLHGHAIGNIERIVLGLQTDDYHPERHASRRYQ
jgi:hypothetical protein